YPPAMNVLESGMYKNVNLDVAPSAQPSGLDLPLNDISTLRFFFNLGVHQSRVVLHSQKMAKTAAESQPLHFIPAAPVVAPAARAVLNLQQQLQAIQASLQLQLQKQLQQAASAAAAQPQPTINLSS
ncbi:hypothetical protein PENTCL1PPCAC_16194, partial [Pristionchus entomophagus]